MPPGLAWLTRLLRRPELAVLLPALALVMYWAGGEGALLALALGLPMVVWVLRRVWPQPTALPASDQVINRLEAALRDASQGARQTGCFVLQFDDPSWLCDRHGRTLQSEILAASVGRILLEAAQVAVDEAMRHGPGAIRAYSAELAQARAQRDRLRASFAEAITAGQIRAYFQPQLSTDSGQVSGLEVLARWHHPEQGCLPPGQFLPALEGTDLMELLTREMLTQALAALAAWDRAGLRVPQVAVNFAADELRDPQLPERLVWALDRHDLAPSRLTVEVLESVVAGEGDDIITRNISRVAQMGCGVDLDDFGTGNASINAIRRFALQRLKIDRSFVRDIDTDRGQQKLVTAILSLAEKLGLDTLAEGVETRGEHAMLAQLGCGHVQGYVIARPMPFDDVAPWLLRHQEGLVRALRIDMKAR